MPPGSKGWLMVGESMEWAFLGSQKFIKDRMEKYSPEVLQTSLFGEKIAVFCGAQGNKFLFTNEKKAVTSWWPQSMFKVLNFPESVESNSKEVSALKRRFHHDILKAEVLKHYIAVMDELARQHLDTHWIPNSVVKVLPMSRKHTLEVACRLFINVVDPDRINKLLDPLALMSNGMLSAAIDLPGTAYHGVIKGGKMVHEELMRIIKERRRKEMKEKGEGRDLLSKMLVFTDEDGKFLSEMEISNNTSRGYVRSTHNLLFNMINL